MSGRKKWFIGIGVFVFLLIILIVATKFYLVLQLLLGNDLVVSVNSDREIIKVEHGQSDNVTFKYYILTNPFCDAHCNSTFTDLGDGKVIDYEEFKMRSVTPSSIQFDLRANNEGVGKEFYRFEVSCQSPRTLLCHTDGSVKSRNKLIVMEYNLTTEEIKKINVQKNISNSLVSRLNNVKNNLIEINASLNESGIIEFKQIVKNTTYLIEETNSALNSSDILIDLWNKQEYDKLDDQILIYNKTVENIKNQFSLLNITAWLEISSYNVFVSQLNDVRNNLNNLSGAKMSTANANSVENLSLRFNAIVNLISNGSLNYLTQLTGNLSQDLERVRIDISSGNDNSSFASFNLSNISIGLIELEYSNYSNVSLIFNEPKMKCCLLGKCYNDCNLNQSTNYPVILLHGHDFSASVSAEHALDAFDKIQKKMEQDGYLNVGPLLLGDYTTDDKNIFAQPLPLTVKASYYFDINLNTGKNIVIQTKADNIDTYAIRLKDTIDVLKYKTGKDKVDVVAHSMGGLVLRRYMEIFGSDSINKVVLIGTPNEGIDSETLSYCNLFGATTECSDLAGGSLLMSKLANAKAINIPVYNIVGTGCLMGNETGDGIVLEKNGILSGANNILINGTCNPGSFEYLHTALVDPDKYPEVYRIIIDSLNESSR